MDVLPDPKDLSSNGKVCLSPGHRRVQRDWIAEPRERRLGCPRRFVPNLK